ncbi:hypothetical protein [Paenibacillus ferrarius]|nr:hypothetical protein [Paenibacillus ferrarius]
MKDWAVGLTIAIIVFAVAGCTAVGMVSDNNKQVEIAKLQNQK